MMDNRKSKVAFQMASAEVMDTHRSLIKVAVLFVIRGQLAQCWRTLKTTSCSQGGKTLARTLLAIAPGIAWPTTAINKTKVGWARFRFPSMLDTSTRSIKAKNMLPVCMYFERKRCHSRNHEQIEFHENYPQQHIFDTFPATFWRMIASQKFPTAHQAPA